MFRASSRNSSLMFTFKQSVSILVLGGICLAGCNTAGTANSTVCDQLQAEITRINGEIGSNYENITQEQFCELGQVLLEAIDAGCTTEASLPGQSTRQEFEDTMEGYGCPYEAS